LLRTKSLERESPRIEEGPDQVVPPLADPGLSPDALSGKAAASFSSLIIESLEKNLFSYFFIV